MSQRRTISVAEAARRSGLSRSTINRLIRDRVIRSSKVVGRRLIDLRDFDRVIVVGVDPSNERKWDGNRDAPRRARTSG